jgi:hypothetical protein
MPRYAGVWEGVTLVATTTAARDGDVRVDVVRPWWFTSCTDGDLVWPFGRVRRRWVFVEGDWLGDNGWHCVAQERA